MSDQFTLEDREDVVRLREAWDHVLRSFADDLSTTVINRFLKPLKPLGLEKGVALISVPSVFITEWVREKFLPQIEARLSDELGERVRVELRTGNRERPQNAARELDSVPSTPLISDAARFRPNVKFRFDTYVVGPSNRLAYAGAQAVASDPGSKYNPLFIYGPSGLGKTHLLHAIGHELLDRDPKVQLAYVSAQQFAEEFVAALQNRTIEQFRRAQRNVSVWLVDDIQFIAGKERTQEEIFHTFNYLHQSGKQIVLCADRPPREIFLMDERLRSRFESGLVADIQPPDTETRCAILLSKASQENMAIDHAVAMHLAENVPGNIRILEGALTKIWAQASLEGREISLDLADQMIEKYYRTGGLIRPGFDQIVDAVGKYFNIPQPEIKGSSRKAPIAHARHVAVYITREITGDSWKHIGSLFGDRDHTSMMHAYQKISEMMTKDRDLNASIKMLIRNLYPDV